MVTRSILGINGTPDHFRPSATSDTDSHVEEFINPHANADDDADMEDEPDLKTKLRRIRMTANDFRVVGHTD